MPHAKKIEKQKNKYRTEIKAVTSSGARNKRNDHLPEDELDCEPKDDQAFHVEQGHIGRFLELVDGGEDAQRQTGEHHHEPVNVMKRADRNSRTLTNEEGRKKGSYSSFCRFRLHTQHKKVIMNNRNTKRTP